uniref:Putative secreted protein n=1 Tax=Anopheles darlingi TaxID=43151 RepID=A0A2M4DHB8_ANODA
MCFLSFMLCIWFGFVWFKFLQVPRFWSECLCLVCRHSYTINYNSVLLGAPGISLSHGSSLVLSLALKTKQLNAQCVSRKVSFFLLLHLSMDSYNQQQLYCMINICLARFLGRNLCITYEGVPMNR